MNRERGEGHNPEEQLEEERKARQRAEDALVLERFKREEAERRAADAERKAITDELTGLYNRHGFKGAIELMAKAEVRMSVLILDIDDFKKINDTYGHRAGDTVLKAAAEYLQSRVRKGDIVARWGGEEFVIAFRKTDAQGVVNKFYLDENRVRQEKSRVPFTVTIPGNEGEDVELNVTFSGGVKEYNHGDTIDENIDYADEAMYDAKESGKDQILAAK